MTYPTGSAARHSTTASTRFVQPGDEVEEPTDMPANLNPVLANGSGVLLLWSAWGLEGIFTNQDSFWIKFRSLRGLAAYKNEKLTAEVRGLDTVI